MSTRAASNSGFDPIEVQRAAVLVAMGFKQAEIVTEMSVSLPKLSRLTREAKDRGLLLPPIPPLDWSLIDEEVWDHLCDPELLAEVRQRLNPYGVGKVRLAKTDTTGRLQTKPRVMRTAALVLSEVMHGVANAVRGGQAVRAPVLGFTGGSMLRLAIDHAPLPERAHGTSLVALAGDPAVLPTDADFAAALQSSANGVVGKLANRLQLSQEAVWRFPLPETRLPVSMPDVPTSLLRAFARQVPAVAAILGVQDAAACDRDRPEPLIERMGTVFAELEPPAEAMPGWSSDPDWVAGRINGHLIARRGAEAAAKAECELRNGFALGASPADRARVAARARPYYHQGRGVILVASGPAAADGVLALVAAKAVNELIIDSEMARAIVRGLKRPVHPEEPVSLRAAV